MSLKDFEIGAKLGEGAYSTVFKVQRLADKQIYALKKVKLANLSQKEVENALNEVRILASLKTKSIIGYKEVFLQGKNLWYCSCNFADDGDLYQKIADSKKKKEVFEENHIWSVLIQTLNGLKMLHRLNILHRDLKSANIFLNKAGEAKLGDLNVSKVAKNGLLYTQTGTPYYASPEVWKDEPYDSKSDIWSLGCVIYEMTTLQPPFKAEDMQGLFKAVTLGVYPPIGSKYSKELAHIIKLMLQQKPKNRPSAEKILSSALIQKKIEELHLQSAKDAQSPNQQLLSTIRLPKKLHYLTDRLPKPNYQNLSENDKGSSSMKNSPSLRHKDRNSSKGSLPPLVQMLQPGLNYIKGDRSRKKKISGDILMIEGRSKIIEDARNDNRGVSLEREIRDELKRIYKVKGEQRNKRSEKSIILPPIKL